MPDHRTRKEQLVNEHFDLMLKDTKPWWGPALYPTEEQIRDQAEIDAELRRER